MSETKDVIYTGFVYATVLMIGMMLTILPSMIGFPTQYLPVGFVLIPLGIAIIIGVSLWFDKRISRN